MAVIKDEAGDEFLYWPLSLLEGETSQVLTIKIDTPVIGGKLLGSKDERAKVWARRKGVGATYADLSTDPIALGSLPSGETQFEIYVEALSPISGFERVPLSVAAATQKSAGWLI